MIIPVPSHSQSSPVPVGLSNYIVAVFHRSMKQMTSTGKLQNERYSMKQMTGTGKLQNERYSMKQMTSTW